MRTRFAILVFFALASSGCPSLQIEVPEHFVELDPPRNYEFKAMNADGVVLAVRRVKNEAEGSLEFWTLAVKNRLRALGGYALKGEKPWKAGSGQEGHLLRFGKDEGKLAYSYWVWVYSSGSKLWLVEAGGHEKHFDRVRKDLEQSVKGLSIL